jgi:hypothetical protein
MNQPAVPMASPPNTEGGRSFSRTSRANGSAYGYNGSFRSRVASNTNINPRSGSLSTSMRRRRGSNYDHTRDPPTEGGDLNFAQRLLLANENAVTNIADLWVASAMNVDNENPFDDSDIEDDDVSLDLGVPMARTDTLNSDDPSPSGPPPFGFRSSKLSPTGGPLFPRTNTINSIHTSRPVSTLRHSSSVSHRPSVSFTPTPRRLSTNVPSIFAHPGVKTPTAVLDAQQLLNVDVEQTPDSLQTIVESRQSSPDDVESLAEKPPSLMSQLPIIVIIQYGVMALHTTTHDQIFMSYLVS